MLVFFLMETQHRHWFKVMSKKSTTFKLVWMSTPKSKLMACVVFFYELYHPFRGALGVLISKIARL